MFCIFSMEQSRTKGLKSMSCSLETCIKQDPFQKVSQMFIASPPLAEF